MERTSRLQLKVSSYLEKEWPELLYVLGERDSEIEDLTEELDQSSARLEYLEWIAEEQETRLRSYQMIFLFVILPIIITLLVIIII